jgi:hypothetical protein
VSLVGTFGFDVVFVEGNIPNPVFRFHTPVSPNSSEQLALNVGLLQAYFLVGQYLLNNWWVG